MFQSDQTNQKITTNCSSVWKVQLEICLENKCFTCCHSSEDSSALSILPPKVRFLCTSSMLLSIYIDLCRVEKTKNQKEAGIGPFKKNNVPTKHRPRKTWSCCSGWSHGIRDVVNGGSRPEINLLFRSRDIQFKWIESVLEKEEREKMGKLLLLWLCNRKIWS